MSILDDKDLAYRVAKSYYLDECSQNELALIHHISRSHVSKILKSARAAGMVKIQIVPPSDLNQTNLANKLAFLLGLDRVLIISDFKDDHEFFCGVAEHVVQYANKHQKIGIGWGPATYRVVQTMPYQPEGSHKLIVPLVGNPRNQVPYLHINNIVHMFADKFHSSACFLDVLDLSKDMEVTYCREKEIEVTDLWNNLDMALVGIGGHELKERLYLHEITDDVLVSGRHSSLIGDILTHFFLENDKIFEASGTSAHLSCPLNVFCNIPMRLGLAYGAQKTDAVCFAAKHKLITDLIIDEPTAKLVLAKFCQTAHEE